MADISWVGEIGGSDPVRFGRRKKLHIVDRPHKVFEQETLIRTACSPSPVKHHSAAGVRLGRPPPWVDRNCTSAALAPAPRCRQRAPPTCPRRSRPRRALHWRTSAAPPARRQCRPVGCVAQTAPPESMRRAHTTGSGRSCPARRPGRASDAPRAAGEAIYCRQCFVVTHGMRYGCSRRRQRHVDALIGGGCLPWLRARVHPLCRRRRVARAGGGRGAV